MRVALIADLHGNMPAVEALAADLARRGIRQVWCLGDIVGKGPDSDQTFDWAMANCALILRGNWDEGLGLKLFPNDGFYFEQLGEQRLEALRALPLEKHLYVSGRKLRLLHGRPAMQSLLPPQGEAAALQALFEPDFDVVGYADTHRQGLRTLQGLLFNTGSVGNGLGVNMVQYAILEGKEGRGKAPFDIQFVTLPYDVKKAVQAALAQPALPYGYHYIREITTGQYTRRTGPRTAKPI